MDYYTHLDVLNEAGALDKLPTLPAPQKQNERRTG
jgi:hypothetical protein